MERPDSGTIIGGGTDVTDAARRRPAAYRRTVGFVFQRYNLLPALTALDNVIAPVLPYRTAFDKRERGRELLAAVGLAGREHSLPAKMSGGEQQRVAIARALVNTPALLLADEPTGNLDSANADRDPALLTSLRRDREMTIILATHDPQVAAQCRAADPAPRRRRRRRHRPYRRLPRRRRHPPRRAARLKARAMRKLAWSQLRFRTVRLVALLTGMFLATTAFTVLTAASRTAQLRTVGTVSAHFVPAYDILVRPHGSQDQPGAAAGHRPAQLPVRHLRRHHDGAVPADRADPRRQVAAPIAMVGYTLLIADVIPAAARRRLRRARPGSSTGIDHLG